MMPIPNLDSNGYLPPGVHFATLDEVDLMFGQTTDRRKLLMNGLRAAVKIFQHAKVARIYIDGSFTSEKPEPNDVDGCWSAEGAEAELLDKRFWDFDTAEEFNTCRKSLKDEFGIDFFIAEWTEGDSMKPYPDFFQTDRDGFPKGILQINLQGNL